MSYRDFINSLTDTQLVFLIFREMGYSQREAGTFMGVGRSRAWQHSECIKSKARKHGITWELLTTKCDEKDLLEG